ncbi:hypothetical protein [Endomicrobium proavitum]|nr:hypothetical protein [Endomicrobium proavitum]
MYYTKNYRNLQKNMAQEASVVDVQYRKQFLSQSMYGLDYVKSHYKDTENITKYLKNQTDDWTKLLQSYKGTSSYALDGNVKAGLLDNQGFTYDNAMAVLAYVASFNYEKAAKILRVYQKEFYVEKNGYIGLFTSYRTDDFGYNENLIIGIDGDKIHVGPNAWIAVAALQYTAMTGSLEFLPFVIDMSKWIDSLNHFTFADGSRGGVSMGSGWGLDFSKTFSTENIIDDYALKNMLKDLYELNDKEILKIFKNKKYTLAAINAEMENIENFMMKVVYDNNKKTFVRGYNESGVDTVDPLDTTSWTILAMGPSNLAKMGADPYKMMEFVDKNFLVETKMEGVNVKGYDLTSSAGRGSRKGVIWFEGTNFHIIAMQIMSEYAKKQGDQKMFKYYRDKAVFFTNEVKKAATNEGVLPYTSAKVGEKEVVETFEDGGWEIARGKGNNTVSSMSSTTWWYLVLSAFNPLAFEKESVSYKLFQKETLKTAKKTKSNKKPIQIKTDSNKNK